MEVRSIAKHVSLRPLHPSRHEYIKDSTRSSKIEKTRVFVSPRRLNGDCLEECVLSRDPDDPDRNRGSRPEIRATSPPSRERRTSGIARAPPSPPRRSVYLESAFALLPLGLFSVLTSRGRPRPRMRAADHIKCTSVPFEDEKLDVA
jgi:hypothetical protein